MWKSYKCSKVIHIEKVRILGKNNLYTKLSTLSTLKLSTSQNVNSFFERTDVLYEFYIRNKRAYFSKVLNRVEMSENY